MDKTYVKNFNRVPSYQRGMEIWTEEIVRTDVGDQLKKLFLEQVAKERAGDTIDRSVLLNFSKMMTELGKQVYALELEAPFLDASRQYFECAPSTPTPNDTIRLLCHVSEPVRPSRPRSVVAVQQS
jgi:hypothetical protein